MNFSKFGACDAADALVALGIKHGGAIPFLRQRSGPLETFAGPAYTVEYAPVDDHREAVKGHYIDSVPKGAVVLIATSTPLPHAPYTSLTNSLYGGLMSTRAKYLGANATVVLGSIRDIHEHRQLNYPVFSYEVGICAPNKLAKVVAVNQPLQLLNQVVHPGDIVVADENGVAIVPKDKAEAASEYIPKRVAADTLVAEDIKNGEPAGKSQKERRKNL